MHAVPAARRHHRGRRQLRVHHRAGRRQRDRLPHQMLARVEGMPLESLLAGRALRLAHLRRVPRPHRARRGRRERGLPRRPLRDPSRGDGRGREHAARPSPTSSRRCSHCSPVARRRRARLLVVVGNHAQRRRRRAGAVAPRVDTTRSSSCAASPASTRAPRSSSSPWSAGSSRGAPRAHGRDVGRGEPSAQLERARAERAASRARVRAARAPATTRPSAAARVLALTVPNVIQTHLSFKSGSCSTRCRAGASRWRCRSPRRWRCSRTPRSARKLDEQAHSPEAGILAGMAAWGTHTIVETFAPENQGLAGRVVGDIAAERGQEPVRRAVRDRRARRAPHGLRTRGRAPTTRSRGSCAATCGETGVQSSARPTPAPTSTCCRRSTSPRRCSRACASTS